MFKFFIIWILTLSSFAFAYNPQCSIETQMRPECYHKRSDKVFKVALMYYGDHMKIEDLDRIEPLLIERFYKATGNQLELRVLTKLVKTYRQKMPVDYTYNNIQDPARLQRIWYYENVGSKVLEEIYEEFIKDVDTNTLKELDAIVSITGAQFEGLGFASGRVSATEYPREIAWATEGGGRVELVSDYIIVDELIHELGHNMFLGHTSTQCNKPGMTIQEINACCASSPSKNDVMSYCRKRMNVNETFMHGFEACNQGMIKKLIIPSLLKGGYWNVRGRVSCQ